MLTERDNTNDAPKNRQVVSEMIKATRDMYADASKLYFIAHTTYMTQEHDQPISRQCDKVT